MLELSGRDAARAGAGAPAQALRGLARGRRAVRGPAMAAGPWRDQPLAGGLEGVYCSLGSLLVRSQPASPSQ